MKTLTLNDQQQATLVNLLKMSVEGAKSLAAQQAAASTADECNAILSLFVDVQETKEDKKDE